MENILDELGALIKSPPPPCLAPDVVGFTSPKVRALLNLAVGHLPAGEIYFEIGCLRGATLVSALLGHPHVLAHACDNWSEFQELQARADFHRNLQAYRDRLPPEIVVHEEDCFGLAARKPFQGPIGIYFYDGAHDVESQRRAIVEYTSHFSSEVLVLVDDWNHEPARRGTYQAISEIRPLAVNVREFPASHNGDVVGFWNGVGAFHLKLR